MTKFCGRCKKEMGPDGVTDTTGCKHYCPECVKEMFGCTWQESLVMKAAEMKELEKLNEKYGDYSNLVK